MNPPPSAHLYLAQLSDDPHAALQHYQAAVDILNGQLKGKERATDPLGTDDDEKELRQSIVRALIGMVEIWMDPSYDLWYVSSLAVRWTKLTQCRDSFDPAAEKTCEDLLNSALQTDPGNTEALQALASVRLSQQRPDDAKACLEQAWTQWKDLEPGMLIYQPSDCISCSSGALRRCPFASDTLSPFACEAVLGAFALLSGTPRSSRHHGCR